MYGQTPRGLKEERHNKIYFFWCEATRKPWAKRLLSQAPPLTNLQFMFQIKGCLIQNLHLDTLPVSVRLGTEREIEGSSIRNHHLKNDSINFRFHLHWKSNVILKEALYGTHTFDFRHRYAFIIFKCNRFDRNRGKWAQQAQLATLYRAPRA